MEQIDPNKLLKRPIPVGLIKWWDTRNTLIGHFNKREKPETWVERAIHMARECVDIMEDPIEAIWLCETFSPIVRESAPLGDVVRSLFNTQGTRRGIALYVAAHLARHVPLLDGGGGGGGGVFETTIEESARLGYTSAQALAWLEPTFASNDLEWAKFCMHTSLAAEDRVALRAYGKALKRSDDSRLHERGLSFILRAAQLGHPAAMVEYARGIQNDLNRQDVRMYWLGRSASIVQRQAAHDFLEPAVSFIHGANVDKETACLYATTLYEIGKACRGQMHGLKVFGAEVDVDTVNALEKAVTFARTCDKNAYNATMTWMLASKNIKGLYRDMSRLIGEKVWEMRREWIRGDVWTGHIQQQQQWK